MTEYIASHIEIDARGRARIARRGFKIHVLAALHNHGWTVDDLVEHYDLTPAEIYAGLSYYYDHKQEIDKGNAEAEQRVVEIGVPIEDFIAERKKLLNAPKKDEG